MAVNRIFCATGLIGGSTGYLDSIDGNDVVDKDMCVVMDQTNVRFYVLDDDASGVEDASNYTIINPDSNAGTKSWILQSIAVNDISYVQDDLVVTDDASIGGDLTVTGAIQGATIDATTDFTIGGTVITDGTITDDGGLTIDSDTGLNVTGDGSLDVGSTGNNEGYISLFGDATGDGGKLRWYTANDSDTYINYWEIIADDDDWYIGTNGNSDMLKFIGNGANADPAATYAFSIDGTFAGTTIADLGAVTTIDINGGTIDAVTIGTGSAVTELQVDTVNINGNAITFSAEAAGTIDVTNGQALILEGVSIDDGVVSGVTNLSLTGYIEFDGAGAQVAAWSGADLVGITGTKGDAGDITVWNSDGDLVSGPSPTTVSDFLVATAANTWAIKTLAETGAILEADIDHGNLQGLSTGADHSYIDQDVTNGSTPTFTGTNITAVASFTAADESADVTCFPVFVTAATGTVAAKTGSNLTFNSSTGGLVATTVDATTDFTVGETVITDGKITDSGGFNIEVGADGVFLLDDADGDWIISGSSNGAVGLYHNNVNVFATVAAGISITDGTATAATIGFSSDDLVIKNNDGGGNIYLRSTDGESESNLIDALQAGSVNLYYNNSVALSTTAAGISITDGTATAATIVFNSDDLYITNNDPDGQVYITAERTGTGQSTLFQGDPDGAIVLYHNNNDAFLTRSDGFSTKDASNNQADIYFSTDAWLLDARTHGSAWKIQSESTAGTNVLMAHLDPHGTSTFTSRNTADNATNTTMTLNPDGAVELYYEGTKKFETNADGITLGDAGKHTWDALPASDDTCSGDITSEDVDTNAVGIGAILYMAADGSWDEADADAEATCGLLGMAVEAGTGTKKVLHQGWMHLAGHGFTVGAQLYVSTTQGLMTNTAPAGNADIVQVVGYATDANTIRFNPSPDYLEVTV